MDKEQKSIRRLQMYSGVSLRLTGRPLVMTYSGGKDSDLLLHLAQRAGIPFEVQHSLTTADAPETIYHVKDTFRRLEEKGVPCDIDRHIQSDGTALTMWNLIPKKQMPPTRLVRYCCEKLKEGGGKGRVICTGARWAESAARKRRGAVEVVTSDIKKKLILNNDNDEARREFENCQLKGKKVVNPIVDWTTEEVLDYCAAEHVPMNPLYEEGFCRVGCIGCPMAGKHKREREFLRWPKYKDNYLRAFRRMLEVRSAAGKETKRWPDEYDVFRWWMEEDTLPGQIDILEEADDG